MTEKSKNHPDDVMRDLPVQLTDPDLAVKAQELADVELKVDGLKEQAKALNKDKRAAEGHRLELARIVDTGVEERQVACRWIDDIDQNCKRLVRQDNHEVVDEQPMEAEDHQGNMKFESAQDGDTEPGGNDDGS